MITYLIQRIEDDLKNHSIKTVELVEPQVEIIEKALKLACEILEGKDDYSNSVPARDAYMKIWRLRHGLE